MKATNQQRGVSLIIDIENSIKAQQSWGYEQWAKIHKLKQEANTMNFLTENKIEQYADLLSRIEEIIKCDGQLIRERHRDIKNIYHIGHDLTFANFHGDHIDITAFIKNL